MSGGLGVMLNDLQEIMLGVFKYHEDALVLENDLDQVDHIRVRELRTEGHFPTRRLGNACVLDDLPFFIRLESVCGSVFIDGLARRTGESILLDRKVPRLAIPANGLVDPAVGPTTDESYNSVFVSNPDLILVDH